MTKKINSLSDEALAEVGRVIRRADVPLGNIDSPPPPMPPEPLTRLIRFARLEATAECDFPDTEQSIHPGVFVLPRASNQCGADGFDVDDYPGDGSGTSWDRKFIDHTGKLWPAGSIVQVAQHNGKWYILNSTTAEPILRFVLQECLLPGESAAAKINGTGSNVTLWDWNGWNFLLPGEATWGQWLDGRYEAIGSHGLMRLVEITSESPLACFDTGNAKPLHTIDGFSSPECEIEVTNMSCDTMETGDAGMAFYDHSSETWRMFSKGKPKVAHATLGEDMCADDETASITENSEVAIDCCCGDLSVSSADNPFSLSGESGDLVELQKNCNGGWYVRQVLHGSETVTVYDAGAADCEKLKTRQISAMWCEDQGDPITTTTTVLADARINDNCDFQVQPISICVLGAPDDDDEEPADYVTRNTAQERRYVDTLARSGDDLLVGMSKVKVFCTGSRVDDVIPLCCDGNPPSSSDPADCVECGVNLISPTILLTLTPTIGARVLNWVGFATHDGSVWVIESGQYLFEDGVPTEIAVSGSVSCVDGDLVAAITLTEGAETHEYTFTIEMAENEGGTHMVGEETQNELGDVPVHNPAACSGEDNGTTVAHCGNNDDYLCFTFTPPAENVSFNVRIYDCEGNLIWEAPGCANSFGETLDPRTQQTTIPVLSGIGTDWVVVIDWYEYEEPGTCTNLLRTDTIPGPDAGENCGGGGNCTIRLHIASTICEGESSVTGPFLCEGADPTILGLANFVRHASLPGGEVDIEGFQETGISCNRYKYSDNGQYIGSHTYDIAIDGVESLCLIEVSCWCGDVPDGPHQIMIRILTITGETQTAAQSEWQDASGGPPWQLEITQVGLLSGLDVLDALLGLIFEVDNT